MIFLVLLPAALCDLYQYRVPNIFVCIGLVLSLCEKLISHGVCGILYFGVYALVPFVVCFIFYLLHMFGAGDIKLFSIISSYYSFSFCVRVMMVSLLIGALFSIIKMIQQKSFVRRFRHFFRYVSALRAGELPQAYYDMSKHGEEGVIPFTICITLAVIICM